MRALITGACGFVGKYLISHLLEHGDQVLGTVSHEKLLDSSFACKVLDVTNRDQCSKIISEFDPEVIYHLAGISFVPEAEANFDQALQVNVNGTSNIVRTCHLLQTGTTIVFVSSAEVYGKVTPGDLPLTESAPLRPANNYSLSKLMAELVMERYDRLGYVRSLIVRPFNHIGPGQNERFVTSSFAKQLASIVKHNQPRVIEVGNLDAARDFSDVQDIIKGYRLAALKGQGIYNLGSGEAVTIQQILDLLIEIAGVKVEIKYMPDRMRPSEVPVIYGSCEKAKQELGWEPQISLRQSLEKVYQYWYDKS